MLRITTNQTEERWHDSQAHPAGQVLVRSVDRRAGRPATSSADATRPELDPVESVHRLAELGASHVTFHDDDVVPFGSDDAATRPDPRSVQGGARRHRHHGRDGHDQHVHATRSSRTARSPPTTVGCVATGCARSLRNVDLAAELGADDVRHVGRPRGRASTTAPRTSTPRIERYAEGIDTVAGYIKSQGYDLRIALEPKPNEPRGDILLPTVGHALALHRRSSSTATSSVSTPRSGHEQMAGLNYTHRPGPGVVVRASCSTSTSTASGHQVRPGPRLRSRRPVLGLRHRRPARERLPDAAGPATPGPGTSTTSPRAPRTWRASGSRPAANMATYILLKERALAFRADPEVQAGPAGSGVYELAEPTLATGETLADLMADRSAFEDLDIDEVGVPRLRLRAPEPVGTRARDRCPLKAGSFLPDPAGII